MRVRIAWVTALGIFALACGDSSGGDGGMKSAGGAGGDGGAGGGSAGMSSAGAAGASGTGGSAGTGATSGGGTGGNPPLSAACPTVPPAQMSSCTDVDLVCEYGSDPNPKCNTVAWCQRAGVWTLNNQQPAMGECPTQGDILFGMPQMGCPSSRPRIGSACDGSVRTCLYNNCSGIMPARDELYILLNCEDGTWRQRAPLQGYVCPQPS